LRLSQSFVLVENGMFDIIKPNLTQHTKQYFRELSDLLGLGDVDVEPIFYLMQQW
jgi:hypothetical protein